MNDPLEPTPLPDSLHAALGDVGTPADAQRESAIAAALAAYDEMFAAPPAPPGYVPPAPPGSGSATPPARVVDLDSRRRRTNRFLAAAAAVVVIAGGALAINNLTSDSDTGSDANARTSASVFSRDAAPSTSAAAGALPAASKSPSAPDAATTEEEATASSTAASTATGGGSAASTTGTPTIGPIDGPAVVLTANQPDQLPALAEQLVPSTPPAQITCLPAGSTYLGSIYYQGAAAVLIQTGSTLQALSATDCAVLASADR